MSSELSQQYYIHIGGLSACQTMCKVIGNVKLRSPNASPTRDLFFAWSPPCVDVLSHDRSVRLSPQFEGFGRNVAHQQVDHQRRHWQQQQQTQHCRSSRVCINKKHCLTDRRKENEQTNHSNARVPSLASCFVVLFLALRRAPCPAAELSATVLRKRRGHGHHGPVGIRVKTVELGRRDANNSAANTE